MLEDIILIDIAYVKEVCHIIQVHSIILSGLFKAKSEHKSCPFIFADNATFYIWLLYQNPKLTFFITPKSNDFIIGLPDITAGSSDTPTTTGMIQSPGRG